MLIKVSEFNAIISFIATERHRQPELHQQPYAAAAAEHQRHQQQRQQHERSVAATGRGRLQSILVVNKTKRYRTVKLYSKNTRHTHASISFCSICCQQLHLHTFYYSQYRQHSGFRDQSTFTDRHTHIHCML